MAMVVKNNMSAVRTLNTLNANTSALQKSLQKVSSGMKINSAQDDASGYAISERMRVRIRSLDQANQNTQNDASLMKTAEGAVGNTVEILRALKEKAINAANDSNTDEDRQTIQKEINQFIDQIDDNALVQFNGKYLIDGSKNNATISSKTILLNQSLEAGTLETDALTTLNNRAGDSLGIQTSDKWQVSYVQNGNINFASGTVGENSLAEILNLSWQVKSVATDSTGATSTVSSPFGQVKATTNDGLISKGSPTIESLGTYKPGGTQKVPDDMMAAIEDYAGGKDATFTFADIGFYSDKNNSTTFTLSDGSTVESSAIKVTYTAKTGSANATATVETLDKDTEVFGIKVDTTNTTDKAIEVEGVDLSTYKDAASGLDATSTDTTSATGKLVAAVKTLIPDTDSQYTVHPGDTGTNSGSINQEATAKLSGLTGYYIDAEGNTTDDIIVHRSLNFPNTESSSTYTISSSKIWFTKADGTDLDSGTSIYEDNPDYTTAGTGFTDAPDKFGKAVYTPDKTAGIAVASTGNGVNNQISGLTISILDQDGNVKKAANAALDQFKQYQRAENQTGDMSLNFHIGSEANVAIKVGMSDMRSEALGLKGSDGTRLDVYTKEHANAAINVIENALTKALDQQTTIGAIEARLEYTSTNLTTSSENVQAAESTIRDADMAKEMTNYTKSNVLLQAAQAMLAQANQNSSAVLSLLQ